MIDIDKLIAGPELDALVAEKVMGMVWYCDVFDGEGLAINGGYPYLKYPDPTRRRATPDDMKRVELDKALIPEEYSTDIAAAWEVVRVIQKIYPYVEMKGDGCLGLDSWRVKFWGASGYAETDESCEELPLAICRAALKAVGA